MNARLQFNLSAYPRLPLLALAASAVLLGYTAVMRFLQHYAIFKGLHDFWPPVVVLALFLLAWGSLNLCFSAAAWLPAANRALLPLAVFWFIFTAYHHLGCWLGWVYTLDQTYWDQLAISFLRGHLYLENPNYFHDLTLYQDRWYIPNPPLPGLLLVPYTLLVGEGSVNTVRFSMVFAALNGLLVFLILGQAARLKWLQLDLNGRLWLTALFAFGTPILYVGLTGQVWFISQTMTVTFVAMAVYTTLKSGPGWLAGLCLGAAVMARPNVAVMWPFLIAVIAAQVHAKTGKLALKPALAWAIGSALPVFAAVFALLFYNYARFGSWMDFGYTTINGAEQIVYDAQTYGIFNIYFIPRNLWTMFLLPPGLKTAFPYVQPSRDGMSLLLTTPALLYLVRRQSMNLWKLGALAAILLSFGLLVLYHNTGAFQFGYRYLLDFAVPLWLLLAAGLGKRIPRLLRVLILLSIVINLLGTIWFAYNW